ncbi:phage baseplate upper protein [Pediococcus pentosaceus]|uniref:phage baseplate upper protein n=1 Tax=Pediococcus pentosaceus TaxID=1255 RepID=UPI0018E1C18F|nr:phage baseplate upper protein [Pediococcus pentosaceus]MBF7103923.1 phage baseplate upper protein [Pediococcus pentosaceus]QQC62149.1 phage baseplate upper protein [Pediococcus pentosaceus]QQC62194.1 phage baseplate upper protein [Pediococcus pentosaceus]
MANQDLVYDITKVPELQVKQQTLYARVGDGGLKAVTVKVLSNQADYNLTGLEPRFEGVKADGTRIIDQNGGVVLDPQGGVFRYVFPKQAFTAKGDYVQAFFVLIRGNQVDSTIDLNIKVQDNQVEFGINSKDYLTEYDQLIKEVTDKEENFKNDLNQRFVNYTDRIKAAEDRMAALEARFKANDYISHSELEGFMVNHALFDLESLNK